MATLRQQLKQGPAVLAPLVLNPLMAKLAEAAGFRALYLGGGASGYQNVFLEANLTLTEMCAQAVQIRAASALPLILDGAGGWGDPMHMHRTIGMTEAAGFAAIEIEDQILPKRAHHHIGIEHIIPMELMVAKIKEACAARRNPETVIIGRTNAARMHGLDEALRRAAFVLNKAVTIGFFASLAWAGTKLLEVFGSETLSSLDWVPLAFTQSALPIGAALFILAELLIFPEGFARAGKLESTQSEPLT